MASSVYARATKMHVTPAIAYDSMTAGPEYVAATIPVITNTPVPIIAPSHNNIRSNAPKVLLRPLVLPSSFIDSKLFFVKKLILSPILNSRKP